MPPAVEPVPEEAVAATITRSQSTADATDSPERKNSEIDVYAPAEKYYGSQNLSHRPKRTFTFSAVR